MLKDIFYSKLRQLIDTIESTQSLTIDEASARIADAMEKGNCIHVFDTGHMLDSELINRAGGMNAFQRLRFDFAVENPVRNRAQDSEKNRRHEGLMRFVLSESNLCKGDVLIVGSVSGKSVFPVDIAITAKEMGAYVIAITSLDYSRICRSDHSTGKRLFEVADLVLDNCAPPLDAMVEVPELRLSMCPASGLGAATIMWAIEAQTTENLLGKGIKPTILKSINFPGSKEFNEHEYTRYAGTGH